MCQRLAGFGGDRLGHAAEALSLTASRLATGLGRGEPRLPRNPVDAGDETAMVNVYAMLLTSNVLVNQ